MFYSCAIASLALAIAVLCLPADAQECLWPYGLFIEEVPFADAHLFFETQYTPPTTDKKSLDKK